MTITDLINLNFLCTKKKKDKLTTCTIKYALDDCSVIADTANHIVYRRNTVFSNSFTTCIDIEFSELEYSWKNYSNFSVSKGCTILRPGTKVNIWAFAQWKRDIFRLDKDSASVYLNVSKMIDLIDKNEMPKSFIEKMEYMDWKATLVNFLK